MPQSDNTSQFIIYQAEDGQTKLDVRFQDETVWLSQQLMAELFSSSKQNIGQHLKNIFEEQELLENSVVKDFFTTAVDGKQYRTKRYNLDAIISVGYRVKSRTATRFRQWATRQLREYIVKGFVLDDERLKNIYEKTELDELATVEDYSVVRHKSEGRLRARYNAIILKA